MEKMLSLDNIREVLVAAGIPVGRWGKGTAKSLQDLFTEIKKGESHITITGKGVVRVVNVVNALIVSERGILLEKMQVLPNGSKKIRMTVPGGKVAQDELAESALRRELNEELGVFYEDMNARVVEVRQNRDSRPSRSFPGLFTDYCITQYSVRPSPQSAIIKKDRIRQKDANTGRILVFEWVRPGILKEKCCAHCLGELAVPRGRKKISCIFCGRFL